MKIIAASDSHGDLITLEKIAGLQADAFFHCGDSELEGGDPVLQPFQTVKGNCDFDQTLPSVIQQEVGGKQVLVVHGHEHDVKRSPMKLLYFAKEQEADIVLFGHSHLFGAEMIEDILFVNPGSTLLPRDGNEPTFAIIEWNESFQVQFCDLEYKPIYSRTYF